MKSNYPNLSLIAFVPAITIMLSGCVSVPSGPNVMAMPGAKKTYEQFRSDDIACRREAQQRVGPYAAGHIADNATGTAVAGTLIGAAAGALVGAAGGRAGEGAAIGAGSGLLVGSSVAGNNANLGAGEMQRQLNIVYIQCMYAKGNQVPMSDGYYSGPYQGYAPYYYPRRGYGVPPDYVPY